MNFGLPPTGEPMRGEPLTAGSDAGSSAASLARLAGANASSARSFTWPERSRSLPSLSISPGFFAAERAVSYELHCRLPWGLPERLWNRARGNSTARHERSEPQKSVLQRGKSESIALAHDVAGTEVTADHQCRRIRKTREQCAPRYGGLQGIGIRRGRPVEMRHLHRMMCGVAGQQRFLACGFDMHAHMAGAVARCRDQRDLVRELRDRWQRDPSAPASAIGFTESLNTARCDAVSLCAAQ